jgi:hypothetical protein
LSFDFPGAFSSPLELQHFTPLRTTFSETLCAFPAEAPPKEVIPCIKGRAEAAFLEYQNERIHAFLSWE